MGRTDIPTLLADDVCRVCVSDASRACACGSFAAAGVGKFEVWNHRQWYSRLLFMLLGYV
jgi:hypothetical protein